MLYTGRDTSVTGNVYNTRLREYITFGFNIHYLLKSIIIQFVALLLTYQFARPLSISVSSPDLFITIYSAISVAFFIVTFLFIRNMCNRSVSPKMHNKKAMVFSAILYHVVASTTVVFGYLFLIVAVNGLSQINTLDMFLSLAFTTAFTAILTVGYHDELDDRMPSVERLEDGIDDWINNTDWVNQEDNSQSQRNRLDAFEQSCDELKEVLSSANTQAGKQLAEEFDEWVSDFKSHSGIGKEQVIQGQKNNRERNQELHMEHREFERLRSRLKDLSRTYD